MANKLVKLGRLDEARQEIQRAIECAKPFGHAAEPWKTWNILRDIESATGHADAAQAAWVQARDAYLAYRREGGYAQQSGGKLCEQVLQAIQSGQDKDVGQALMQLYEDPSSPKWLKVLIPILQTILGGDHNPALAEDFDLDYDDSAELLLLLERLGGG